MRSEFVAVCAAVCFSLLAGCADQPPAANTQRLATDSPPRNEVRLLASASRQPVTEETSLRLDPINLEPIVRLRGFTCTSTGQGSYHCTKE